MQVCRDFGRTEVQMKRIGSITVTTVLFFTVAVLAAAETGEKALHANATGYSVGYQIGQDFKEKGLPIDPDAVARGVRDALEGKESALSQRERGAVLEQIQRKMQATRQARVEAEAQKNLEDGMLWLAENAAKEGVVARDDGLEYKILKEGTGMSPGPNDTVTVNYTGRLIDGTVFDSSSQRGKPSTFQVDGVIKGWSEALQLMKEGAKWQLFIPPDLAYGTSRPGPLVPPNSVLIFDVELLKVEPTEKAAK